MTGGTESGIESCQPVSGIAPSVVGMETYVLIPGFWLGGWAWRPVTQELRARGQEVFPVTLTGMAERVGQARPDTDLEVHVTDVLDLLRYEDLTDVVLVGHSYAGAVVVPAVADRAPERISRLVFVDCGPLPDGAANADFAAPDERARQVEQVTTEGDGWKLPPPPWARLAEGVEDLDPRWVTALTERSVPQPWATATTPASLTGAWEKLPRLGVLSTFTERQARELAASVPLMRHMDGDRWRYVELPSWHWPMFTRPAELADALTG